MATPGEWVSGARPRTLPASVSGVLAGTGVAAFDGDVVWTRALLALVLALALQVGVNYANDYSDGVRGTDAARVGPVRLVGQGLATPAAVRAAALAALGVAALAGLGLEVLTGAWGLLVVGGLALASAWLYTGGPRPYGYAGLGEAFVFVFFGLVAVAGTAFVQTGRVTGLGLVAGAGVGCLTCAILVANNLRDIPGDAVAGKRTLAVRLGDARTRVLYAALVGLALLVPVGVAVAGLLGGGWPRWAWLGALAGVLAAGPLRAVRRGDTGRDLVAVLAGTGRLTLAYGALLGAGIALG